MKKNTRTLLITLISFAVLVLIAAIAYNGLRKNAPAVSFAPTLASENQAVVTAPASPAKNQSPSDGSDNSGDMVAEDSDANAAADEEKAPVMPNLPLTRLDGTMTTYDDVRDGRPAVINYFASWCPPCKEELPHFQKAFDEYGDEISFIFLDALDGQRETLKTVNAFINDFPFTGPVFYDKGEFAMTFQTNSLPTTLFLDKEGRVVKGYLGIVPEEVLYADIAELLN